MRAEATIRIPGAAFRLAPGVVPPSDGVSIDPHDVLYIEGRRVGEVVPGAQAVRADVERIFLMGMEAPVDRIVLETEIDCVLEL